MAHENIQISYPNFCLTPQAGTFATINTSDPTTVLRIKNTSGGVVEDFTLSSNIHPDNTIIGLEYCGPLNLTSIIDNVTFFTLERVPDYDTHGNPLSSSSKCIVKRWETNVGFSLLNLKQQMVKYTTGLFYYDVTGMAVEHYNRSFDFSQPIGQNYIDISSAAHITSGSVLFLGPSTDIDNMGATEKVTVSHTSGNRIWLNSPTLYEYRFGDQITFFNNIYITSKYGLGGDTRYGTIYKHDAYSGNKLEYTTSGEYARISGARWSTNIEAIAAINKSQLLFIRPYVSYLKWKSMFLSNIESSDIDYFEVYDIVFDQFNLYKLMKKLTRKDDSGNKQTWTWTKYNYQQDTLLPYTHNVAIYTNQQDTIGQDKTRIYLHARDQFGVGLRDVNINLYMDGNDPAAEFNPLNGQAITDSDGKANIEYIPSGLYTGPSTISVRADKSSVYTGSEYCWNTILIDGKVEYNNNFGAGAMFQKKQIGDSVGSRQIVTPFKVYQSNRPPDHSAGFEVPAAYLICKSYFGTPGGDWDKNGYEQSCWPWFQTTPSRTDGPKSNYPNSKCGWDCITWTGESAPACLTQGFNPRANFITQILEFTQFRVPAQYYLDPDNISLPDDARPLIIPQPLWFWQYYKDVSCAQCQLEGGRPIPHKLFQIDSENELHFSQLNLSKHSYWVDGHHSLTLNTNVRLDQFIFVEDAVPVFWSEKNPRETDIWIRLRPFAFSLNGDTLKFFVREVWTVNDTHYDTGYYDVVQKYGWPPNNDKITLNYFDAGGGALGIEFTYDNPDIYHHNAIVYVHIEVEDTAAEPNFIYTDYWFKIIPDYNSPYIVNMDPDREEDQVPLDTKIYFEIKDDGEGVDIDTLEVYLNSRIIYHSGMSSNPGTNIVEVNKNHYKVTIALPYTLQYDKAYSIGVIVSDISDSKNILRDSYRFYTKVSDLPWFTDFDPKLCKRGMPRFRDVSFLVLGSGDGVDKGTIKLQVHDKDVTDKSKIVPVIYRIS